MLEFAIVSREKISELSKRMQDHVNCTCISIPTAQKTTNAGRYAQKNHHHTRYDP
jgi:hypothetical protein